MRFLAVAMKGLGLSDQQAVDPGSRILLKLMDMYSEMGDRIALQYGGSEAHKKVSLGLAYIKTHTVVGKFFLLCRTKNCNSDKTPTLGIFGTSGSSNIIIINGPALGTINLREKVSLKLIFTVFNIILTLTLSLSLTLALNMPSNYYFMIDTIATRLQTWLNRTP
jgi:hypothetical protein